MTLVDPQEFAAPNRKVWLRRTGWTLLIALALGLCLLRWGGYWLVAEDPLPQQVLRQQGPSVRPWIHGVADPEFHAAGWWHDRRSAKTWFMESTKLLWTLTER